MKAIETEWKGCRFRSRLEARWAVFFEDMGFDWRYEPQGFEMEGGEKYLPDFWLQDVGYFQDHHGHEWRSCWIEVKGRSLNKREQDLAQSLAAESGSPVFALLNPRPFQMKGPLYDLGFEGGYYHFWPRGDWDGGYNWAHCPVCDQITFAVHGMPHCDHTTDHPSNKIRSAYKAARSARFEHGETPLG